MNRRHLIPLFLLLAAAPMTYAAPAPTDIHVEAEDGQLDGPVVSTQRAGYTGSGYVTGFANPSDKLVLTIVGARAGAYDLSIRYSAPSPKGFQLLVDGKGYEGNFQPSGDGFAEHDAGNVLLRDGQNTVEIDRGWGWFDIDSIDLRPAIIAPLRLASDVPVNPNATPQTRALEAYLASQYGSATLSGQHTPSEGEYIQSVSGKLPAIVGNDFIDYSSSRVAHGANPGNVTEEMIQKAKAGQIVSMMWHWNAPADLIDKMETDPQGNPVNHLWYFGFYTASSTFDVQKALDNPESADYQLLLSDMDTIAAQLQKFQEAGIPVLWRPLHEGPGGWFWWGAKGPEAYKRLWRLMYDRFTNYHHLNNLLWVYTSGSDPAWYPGDNYVDIVGQDLYPSDVSNPESDAWNTMVQQYGSRKLIALTEFGGAPDIPTMKKLGIRWSYFYSWTGDVGPRKNSPDSLTAIYNSPSVITADRLSSTVKAAISGGS